MSASSEAPPPIDSSDNGAKTSTSASSALTSSGMAATPIDQRQADADRREAKHDRDHRPAQHADAEHGGTGYGERCGARRSELHELEAGGEGQADRGSRHAVKNRLNR